MALPRRRTGTIASWNWRGEAMAYSYTQLSQYLACPRKYRHRYVDGWEEKPTRAAMLFGRAFEQAIAAYFLRQDSSAVLYEQWAAHRHYKLEYAAGETWDRMLERGYELLNRFAQHDRVHVSEPRRDLQVKVMKSVGTGMHFVGYVDAIGELDGSRTIIDWKTSSSCYPARPHGLAALDPQLVCYSWATGIPDVALVVFVRKRLVEIQYLHATISDAQRQEFGRLVDLAVSQIKSGHFPQHSGIRFPQNGCVSCPYLGLCLGREELVRARAVRKPGGDLDWLDELAA